MSNMATAAAPPAVVHPPAISIREIWPWALFAAALLALVYLVAFEQVIHEWVHDGRHLLGFPCH